MESEDGTPPAVVVKRIGESYWGRPATGTLEFTHLREHSDGMTAEVTAVTSPPGASYWGRVNRRPDPHSFATFAKAAEHTVGGEWRAILDATCWAEVKAERTGDPAWRSSPPAPDPARWLVPGLFVLHETNLLFGDGGTAKSTFALALASGRPHRHPDHRGRAVVGRPASRRALPRLGKPGQGAHRAPLGPHRVPLGPAHHRLLPHDAPPADRDDGGDPRRGRPPIDRPRHRGQHDPGQRLRARGGGCRHPDHERPAHAPHHAPGRVPHQPAGRRGRAHGAAGARPYGSVFVRNLSRACVEAGRPRSRPRTSRGGSTHHLTVSYRHDKLNSGPLLPPTAHPLGLRPSDPVHHPAPGDGRPHPPGAAAAPPARPRRGRQEKRTRPRGGTRDHPDGRPSATERDGKRPEGRTHWRCWRGSWAKNAVGTTRYKAYRQWRLKPFSQRTLAELGTGS